MPGQHARARAGRDDDVLGLVGARPERALRRGMLRLHRRLLRRATTTSPGLVIVASPQMTSTLFFFMQEADAAVELRRDAARALHDGARYRSRTSLARQAVILGVLHVVEDLGRAQQRLGRDAAPVEADAAEMLALHDRRLEAELRRADRGDVAAGAGADDDRRHSYRPFAVPSSGPVSRHRRSRRKRDQPDLGVCCDDRGCLDQHPHRALDQLLERRHQLGARGAVDGAMVGRSVTRHDGRDGRARRSSRPRAARRRRPRGSSRAAG